MLYKQIEKIIEENSKNPYPKVDNIYPNVRYANMLYDNFAGNLGELSAIEQYIYEHIQFSNNKELSNILLKIAIMEMRHLELVGDVIKQLGADICYKDSKGKYWSAEKLNYKTDDLKEWIKYNIYTENEAIAGYRKAIMYTKNRNLRRLFERIILDEKLHIQILQKMFNSIDMHCNS